MPPEQAVEVPGVGWGYRLDSRVSPAVVVIPLGSPDAVLLVLDPEAAERVPDVVGDGRAVVLADPGVSDARLAQTVAAAAVVVEHGEQPARPSRTVPAPRAHGVGKRRAHRTVGPLVLAAACAATFCPPGPASAATVAPPGESVAVVQWGQ